MYPRLISLLAASAVVASMERPALADDPSPTPPPDVTEYDAAPSTGTVVAYAPPAAPASRGGWYGWQTLTVDGVSLVTMPFELAANTPSSTYLFVGSLSGFAFGAPLVHAAHGRWGTAAADLGMRVGFLAVGNLAGAAIGKVGSPASCNHELPGCLTQTSTGMVVGATIGALAASLLDASVLARGARPSEVPPVPSFTWSPTASVLPSGGAAGLTGTF